MLKSKLIFQRVLHTSYCLSGVWAVPNFGFVVLKRHVVHSSHGHLRYVTWEIAPGRLQDGSVVDVWGRTDEVNWNMPGSGAPCTSTSRPGRWRSFPYLAEFEEEDAEALWGYLCKQWDRENEADKNPGRKLLRFNFFMLQADVLPQMAFSATRKRLVHSYVCPQEELNSSYPGKAEVDKEVTQEETFQIAFDL